MGAEIARRHAEDARARLKRGNARAGHLHCPSEIHAEDRVLGPQKTDEEADEKGTGAEHAAIGPVDRRRMDPDRDLARLRFRFRRLPDLQDIGRSVACVDNYFQNLFLCSSGGR